MQFLSSITGLHKMEEYRHSTGRRYYMCTLCHAHGRSEDMFKHFIGDKHTDKYLVS